MSVITFNAKALERRTSIAPSVIPPGRKGISLSNGRTFSQEQWDAMKNIPPLKSGDKRAANIAQDTVAFGRRTTAPAPRGWAFAETSHD